MRAALTAAAFLVVVSADVAAAALAPNYERLRELEAVLGSDELAGKIGSRPINGIEATGPSTYRVWTDQCTITVNLVGASSTPAIAGAWRFTIQVGEPQCR
jgi:hypothetical protein